MNLNIPILVLLGSAALAVSMYFTRSVLIQRVLAVLHISTLAFFTVHEFGSLNQIESVYLKADAMAVLFLAVLTIIGACAYFYSFIYTKQRGDAPQRAASHHAALILFLTMLAGVYVSRHIGMVWAFLEASTLTAALLIYHNRTKHSIEATWKYVFVCSIGIAIAFAGILVLSIAGESKEVHDLSFEILTKNAHLMDPKWLKISFLFMLTGFSVKMGVVPLFNVDIDAKDGGPSHVAALLSSVLMIAGFVAIYRVYSVFSTTSIRHWMDTVLMICGILSIVFATGYILKTKNLKRLLAYSSLEHAGIVLIAIATGAWYAAVLHVILHAFAKSAMFFQYAHFFRLFKNKNLDTKSNYIQTHPWGAGVFVLGVIALCALPPMGTFMSELYTFQYLLAGPFWWTAPVIFILMAVLVWAIGSHFFGILYNKNEAEAHPTSHLSNRVMNWETLPQYILLLAVLWLGFLAPHSVIDFINNAAHL